jgi:hypothetical protein
MPFTLFHIAAVLPLLRRKKTWFSATGLIIGSIAPDFEKFMRLGLHNKHSHTGASILYFSCPVSLALAFLFHLVVRDPLIAHLPRFLSQRLARFQRFDWLRYFRRHYLVVLSSIALGAATHLVWDSFTHRKGPLVEAFPELQTHLPFLPFSPPVYGLLGLLTSGLGGWLLLRFMWRLPRIAPAAPTRHIARYWLLASLTALLLLALRVVLAAFSLDAFEFIVTALSAAMVGIVVASRGFRRSSPPL